MVKKIAHSQLPFPEYFSLLEYGRKNRREVYLVGGCLRDLLLHRAPKDWDFIVEGEGIPFAEGFAEEVGGRFFILNGKTDESRVVLKKKEPLFLDFIGLRERSLERELERRDFTINSIALPLAEAISDLRFPIYDFRLPKSKIIDPFKGRKDLKEKRIRLIQEDGFGKDPLRILRAFRLASSLSFSISRETLKKIREGKILLKEIAPERIHEEILTILSTPHSSPILMKMGETGVLSEIFPELVRMKGIPQGKAGGGDLWDHAFLTYEKVEELMDRITIPGSPLRNLKNEKVLKEIRTYLSSSMSKIPLLKLASLLHDIGKPETLTQDENGEIHFYGHDRLGAEMVERMGKKSLRMSRREILFLKTSIHNHMRPHLLAQEKMVTTRAIRRFLREGGEESIGILLLAYGDALASQGDSLNLAPLLDLIHKTVVEVLQQRKTPFKRILNGEDLKRSLGMEPGPLMGEILKRIEEEQLEGRIGTRESALAFAKEWLSNIKPIESPPFHLPLSKGEKKRG